MNKTNDTDLLLNCFQIESIGVEIDKLCEHLCGEVSICVLSEFLAFLQHIYSFLDVLEFLDFLLSDTALVFRKRLWAAEVVAKNRLIRRV